MLTDGYAQYYADRIWQLLPAVYRTLDAGPTPGAAGPLRELVNRIGAQAAVLRRSIDRLGENQSIETCDDWVIPYIGDLVATRIVSCLDAAAQRTDVAKTIYYRRRAGTVGVLEELAADIASRDARVVEFFRRMARTRHQFDPPISYAIENPVTGPAGFTGKTLEIAEGLVGAYSGTPAGGLADLRNPYAASNTGSPFDEYFYTADLRQGSQSVGHFNIRHLGVFVWWLRAFPIAAATPVSNGATPPCFTFDPTGRNIPLFAPSLRAAEATLWGEHWVSPSEYILPVAIRETLWKLSPPPPLYGEGKAFSVGMMAGGSSAALPASDLQIHPEKGVFSFTGEAPTGTLTASYSFGTLSEIGAGGFDYAILADLPQPAARVRIIGGAASDLDSALHNLAANTVLALGDSLTYSGVTETLNVPLGSTTVLHAADGQRPVLRWTGIDPTWTLNGNASDAAGDPTVLILEGMLLQGAEIVLTGSFDSVYLRMMTLDPGTSADASAKLQPFGVAIDGLALRPAILYIEGSVTNLVIERSITGPIRTRNGGAIQQLTATDSILQCIPTHTVPTTGTLDAPTVFDPTSLATALKLGYGTLAQKAVKDDSSLASDLTSYQAGQQPGPALMAAILQGIRQFTPAAAEAAWPLALADLVLGFSEGAVSLSRCTVMGRSRTHRLQVSESILDNVASVDDPQFGCVRFSAYAQGCGLHQPFRCVQLSPSPPIFVSRAFGQPEYARLRADADFQIVAPGQGVNDCTGASGDALATGTLLGGAQNGSEMGAYCLEAIALKRTGLALKFEEYAPIGQWPVWIDVD